MRRFRLGTAVLLGGLGLLGACIGSQDDSSQVVDLRVLGMAMEPPEIMAPNCDPESFEVAAAAATPARFTALIADPKAAGRAVNYRLRVCVRQDDRKCENEGEFIQLGTGATADGGIVIDDLRVGTAQLPSDGGERYLLAEARAASAFGGLGGVRLPLVLQVSAGDEVIFAQKLMVFNCPIVPGMNQNVTPVLPGVLLQGTAWPEGGLRTLSGAEATFELGDLAGLEESYVVPSYELKPVALTEAWKVSWHTTLGRMSPNETGGVDQGGQVSRHKVKWTPGASPKEGPVTFWWVVRDGRGGESWIRRDGYYAP